MTNIVDGHDLDTQPGRADYRAAGGYVEGNSSGGGYSYENPNTGSSGSGGGTQTPTQGATFNTPGGSTGGNPSNNNSNQTGVGSQQYANAIQKLTDAYASGNREAFQRAMYEFDVTFQLDKDKFAEDTRRFNEQFGVTQAGLTGNYQGQPTLPALTSYANQFGQWGVPNTGQATLSAQELYGSSDPYGTGGGQAGVPAGYSGDMAMDAFQYKASPADQKTYLDAEGGNQQAAAAHYFRDVTGAVRASVEASGQQWTPAQLSSWVYGTPGAYATGQAAAAGGSGVQGIAGRPTLAAQNQYFQQGLAGITTAASLQASPFRQQQVLGQLGGLYGGQGVAGFQAPNVVAGVGTAGGNNRGGLGYMQQMIDDIKDPTANQTTMNQILDATPTPNKLNSVDFLRAAPSTQNMVLQAMQEKYGLDPKDATRQIQNTLPQFQAPSTMGTLKR